uniref:Uncharacterized protein n=1 Tax=Arundo donax TaxID=35708 RepID=A0A0A9AT84_ARUDO
MDPYTACPTGEPRNPIHKHTPTGLQKQGVHKHGTHLHSHL